MVLTEVTQLPEIIIYYNVTNTFEISILSLEARKVFEVVNFFAMCGLMSLFGIVTNIINIVIFVKQGLDTTINISFFGLAISDLCSLITLEWASICFNPLLVNSDVPMDGTRVQYLTGTWPHACFGHITCWITAYITVERCLCIALPLKVKQIITPRRTTVIICLMFFINILPFIPECMSVYIDWQFYPERNRSLLTLVYTEHRDTWGGVGFVLFGTFGTVSFPAVIIFTIILAIKLRQQSRWRRMTTRDTKQSDVTNKRDVKTIKMVVLISAVLIVCYSPGVFASAVVFFLPGFSIIGSQMNLFWSVWSCVFVIEAFNSSINILLYYNMSTKYKTMFQEMFKACFTTASASKNCSTPDQTI